MTVLSGAGVTLPMLPITGTYTIQVNIWHPNTGSATLTLSEDLSNTVAINGAAVPFSITRPGQNARLTFAGTAAQQVTVRVTGNTISSVVVRLLRPDGTTQTSKTSSAASFTLTQQTLATTGTYTVQVDPPGVNTGTLNVQVTSP